MTNRRLLIMTAVTAAAAGVAAALTGSQAGCQTAPSPAAAHSHGEVPEPAVDVPPGDGKEQSVVLAGGCFWCVEAVYRPLDGVIDVTSGYAGGTADTANYRAVCSGFTDHAEVVRVRFDPSKITLGKILKVFFTVAHDPTQLNRQGNDTGRQYRSAVFVADEQQRKVVEGYIRQLNEAKVFEDPVVTEVAPLKAFYPAEDYHQDYAALNPDQPYIVCTAWPKVEKLRKKYPELLRKKTAAAPAEE
jgi:peptide-methionine (S)-S-oxide reductase